MVVPKQLKHGDASDRRSQPIYRQKTGLAAIQALNARHLRLQQGAGVSPVHDFWDHPCLWYCLLQQKNAQKIINKKGVFDSNT